MSLLQLQTTHPSYPSMCHVCGKVLRACDAAIVHDGRVRTNADNGTDYGSIGLHIECATILSMRLIADVMDHKGSEHEPRVVRSLRNACETKLKEF
jgi:hypothetical protein